MARRHAQRARHGITLRVWLADPQKLARLAAAGARLRIDGDTAEVLDSFERAGVHALLLKGPSIACWLYDRRDRAAVLRLRPAGRAGGVRRRRSRSSDRSATFRCWTGGGCRPGGTGTPSHGRTPAAGWRRPASHADRRRCRSCDAWQVLSADADAVLVAGRIVPCLGLPARAMHVALHAAQHGPGTQPAAGSRAGAGPRRRRVVARGGGGRRVSSTPRRRSSRGCG